MDIDAIIAQNDSLHTQLTQAIEAKNHDRLTIIAEAIGQSNAQLREWASTSDEPPATEEPHDTND